MTDLLRAQDEILQMMFWMRGEHLGDSVSPEQLNRFLKLDAQEMDAALERLVGRTLLVASGDTFRLTERGIEEGKRRFMDEFSTVLGKETHLACSDPLCGCSNESFDGVCTSLLPEA